MGDILHRIIETVGANQHLAYTLVFLLSFSESFPIIGSIIPGTTIIVAISALVPSGAVDIWWLLLSAILGAIGGDGFAYWLGYRYHEAIGLIWPFRKYPQLISIGRDAIAKHGGKSVFIARFTPAIRAVVPLVAGVLRMNPLRFYAVNIFSAVAWAVAHIVPAVIAGASLALAGAVGGRLLLLIVVLIVLLWLVFILVRRAVVNGLPLLGTGLMKLWQWARHHDNWVSREVLSLIDPTHNEIKGIMGLVVLLVAATWVFVGTLEDVMTGEPLVRADQAVFNFMQDLRSLWGDRLMVAVTELGDAAVTGAVVVAVTLWLATRRAWDAIGYWLGAILFATVFVAALKFALHSPRPLPLYSGFEMYGLPSGHAAVTATAYGFLVILIGNELGQRMRAVLAVGITLFIVLIAFSRLYLGAHWVSDVVAGLTFALAWTAGLGIVYLNHRPHSVHGRGLLATAGIALVAAGSFHGLDRFGADVHRYAMRPTVQHMTAEDWWKGGWSKLPERRIDLAGGLEEPITVQWVGSVNELKAHLAASGWREPPPWTLASALGWLNPSTNPDELPVLTRLHDGRPTRLILVHPTEDGPGGRRARLILRLWRSNLVIEDGPNSHRLWLGSVVEQHFVHVGSLLTIGIATRDENAPRAELEISMAPVRVVSRKAAPDVWGWNGWVLLAHDQAISLAEPPRGVEP